MRDSRDITMSALATAVLFVNFFVIDRLFIGEGVLNQHNAYFFSFTFVAGVFYIRLKIISSELEAVRNDEISKLRSAVAALKDEIEPTRPYGEIEMENPVRGLKHDIEALKDEIATIRSYVVRQRYVENDGELGHEPPWWAMGWPRTAAVALPLVCRALWGSRLPGQVF